ncbi:MAG: DNA gyrase subunit B [Bacillota bacterium]
MAKAYDAKDLQVLEGLDAVRMRPGMYIGTTGVNGLHHLLWEIVDNAIDEAANGFASVISVKLCADGSAVVEDNGRGIPVDIHPKLKMSGVEVVFTKLHAGGKFGDGNYQFSGGLHGVGASVTNALSRWLKVSVYKEGKKYDMEFASIDGKKKGTIKSGAVVKPLSSTPDKSKKSGSVVSFLPDDRVFSDTKFSYSTIKKKLRELAFLNKGVKITLSSKKDFDSEGNAKCDEFTFKGGIADYLCYLNESKDNLYQKPIYFTGEKDGILLECAIFHSDDYVENILSYVNNIPTMEGGTHETGFKSGFTKAFNEYMKTNGSGKTGGGKDKSKKDVVFVGEDFRVGMTAIVSLKMKNVQFEGQTKTKLGNVEAKPAADAIVYSKMMEFFSMRGSGSVCDAIVKKATASAQERAQIKKAKEIARAKNSLDVSELVGKLSSCTGRKAEENELFIVEGDSAGGTAKQGRNRKFQAILPLRGKPLNVEKQKIDKVLANEEIRSIITALGTGIGEDFNIANLKYHKVVILSDADQDGLHIRSILLTFFYRFMRELVAGGHVYIGQPPLYRVSKGNFEEYCYNEQELAVSAKKAGKGYHVTRYKGLGEMSAEQLKNTTLDPENRSLVQVRIEELAEAERLVAILMGKEGGARKFYIRENCNFNKEDEFKSYSGLKRGEDKA